MQTDSESEKSHMDYLVWLAMGGLSRNQGIRRLVFSNVDFGSGDGALFSDIMRTWLNQRASHYRIAFRSCRFGRLSHITALGKCLSTSNIVEIIFVGIDFGDTPPSLLAACLLRTNRKDAIRFVDCAMTSHQTQELIRVIPTTNGSGTLLSIEGAQSHVDADACRLIGAELTGNGSTTSLSLRATRIGDAGVLGLLSRKQPMNLTSLNLSRCNVTDIGCGTIASALSKSTLQSLDTLILRHNRIGDHGAMLIAGALSKNHVLETLSIARSRVPLSINSWKAFETILYDCSNPQSIKASNHSLSSIAWSFPQGPGIPQRDQDFLGDLLLMNASNDPTIASNEKILMWIHDHILSNGTVGILSRCFPGYDQGRESLSQLIALLLGFVSNAYSRVYDIDVWENNPVFDGSHSYWATRPSTTRELTVCYHLVKTRMCSSVQHRYNKRYNLRPWLAIEQSCATVPRCVDFHRELSYKMS